MRVPYVLARRVASELGRNFHLCLASAANAEKFAFGMSASTLLPQAFTNEIAVWAVLNTLLIWILGRVFGRAEPLRRVSWSRAPALSVLAFTAAYCAVVFINAALQTDLRLWFFALKPMSMRQFGMFLVYLVPFSLFFTVALRGLDAQLTLMSDSALKQYITSVVALGEGLVVLLLAQYARLFSDFPVRSCARAS